MAKKAKGNRVQVILECTEHKESGMPGTSRYITTAKLEFRSQNILRHARFFTKTSDILPNSLFNLLIHTTPFCTYFRTKSLTLLYYCDTIVLHLYRCNS